MLSFRGVIKWNAKARDVLKELKPGERPLLRQSVCYKDLSADCEILGRSCR